MTEIVPEDNDKYIDPEEFGDLSVTREAEFLHLHWQYGAVGHEAMADTILERFNGAGMTAPKAHTLMARLHGEYAGVLEALGAWGWAMRNRFKHKSFLDAYLNYGVSDVTKFFKLVERDECDAWELLRVPNSTEFDTAVAAASGEVEASNVRVMIENARTAFRNAANRYLHEERVITEAYNRSKHGAVMLWEADLAKRHEFDMIVRAPKDILAKGVPWRLARFSVTPQAVLNLHRSVVMASEWCQGVAATTALLHNAERLYERPAGYSGVEVVGEPNQ